MKVFVLENQIKFYQENGFIEFYDLLSSKDLENLISEIDAHLNSIKNLSYLEQYNSSRDLFRKSLLIKRIIFNRNIVSIAKILSNNEKLRLIFDQLIISSQKKPFDSMTSINDISAFQGLQIALLLKLDGNPSTDSKYLPQKKGSAIFYNSNAPINFEGIYSGRQKYFLIVYGDLKTIYKLNLKDPNLHFLKQFGYSFGDPLKDEFHPPVN